MTIRLRCHFRIPLAGSLGYDPQNARPRKRSTLHWLWRDGRREPRRTAGLDRRLLHVPRRLLRHQRHTGSVRQTRAAHGEPRPAVERGGRKARRTARAAPFSLAVGMAQIFKSIPAMDKLVAYWYHYAIMFEALFILTTVDAGTRVARYVLQELMGKVHKPLGDAASIPGNLMATALVVFRLGLPDLHRIHLHHLAAVRHRQSVAGHHRAGGEHHVPDQHGQRALCLDHGRADGVHSVSPP